MVMNNKIDYDNKELITPFNNNSSNAPVIFIKKINNNSKVISLNDTSNTLGFTRHYPAATKEWFNSIYAYNKNSVKHLPMANKTLSSLITSYFNMYFNKKILQSKRIPIRFRRMSLNKIFLGKAELKHTSDKVIVTLYVYNEESRILTLKLKRLEALLFPSLNLSKLYKKFKLRFKKRSRSILAIGSSIALKRTLKLLRYENSYLSRGILKVKLLFQNKIENSEPLTEEESLINELVYKNNVLLDEFFDEFALDYIKTELEEDIKTLAQYRLLLNLNRSKFEYTFLNKLSGLIGKIYNKEVQFNIINLKSLHFDSNIFTQVIAAKLKNKNNKLLRVFKRSLLLVRLPDTNRIQEKYGKIKNDASWINKVKNLKVNSMLINDNSFNINTQKDKDILSQLFTDVFSTPQKTLESTSVVTSVVETINNNKNIDLNSVENLVLNSIKYKKMAGARLEAKGRLTKRFTASRSVFKVKWKGSLKNIDSTYKGLSSVILRGHVKSNVQYSVINSKTRNGSFGLKGWISSK